jgi:hypothetical protein
MKFFYKPFYSNSTIEFSKHKLKTFLKDSRLGMYIILIKKGGNIHGKKKKE